MSKRRALLVGVQSYLDPALASRPGTSVYMARIERRLRLGDWEVVALVDEAADESNRPLLTNLLARLEWISAATEALVILSGHLREQRLLPRDARAVHISRTGLALSELVDVLPAQAGVLVDGPVPKSALAGVSWASALAPEAGELGPEPSPYLAAIAHALAVDSLAVPLCGVRLTEQLAVALGASSDRVPAHWFTGRPTDSVLLSAPLERITCGHCLKAVDDMAASFCPHCGGAMSSVERIVGGRYRLLETLGQGGMGQVYLAHDTRMGLDRAIKLLTLPDGLDEREAEILRARLIQEARAAQALGDKTHHVVRVFDVGHSMERGVPFLVMEVLHGSTLRDRINDGPMSISQAVSIAHQIAQTLAIAHPQGMIHRDLKPSNVMLVERDGQPDFVKLLDFGLVKMESAELLTQSGRAMGTLQYMPPEQLQGGDVDARADVFALGAVLFECLTGARANPGKAHHEIFRVLLDSGVQPIAELRADLPSDLSDVIDRCLALDPQHRPSDGAAVAAGLAPFCVANAGHERPRTVDASVSSVAPSPITDIDADEAVASWVSQAGMAVESTPSLATGEIASRVERARRPRWVFLAAGAALAALWLWRVGPTGPVIQMDAGAAPVATMTGQPANTALGAPGDAAPPARPLAPSVTVPAPFARPASPLPAAIEVLRRMDGDAVSYRGSAPAHAFAAIVRDVTLGTVAPPAPDTAADQRWRTLAPGVRAWLADGVAVEGIEARATGLRITRRRLDGLRAIRPHPGQIRRLGRVWSMTNRHPVFEAVNCGRARPGDRLVTARWTVRGYSGGQCVDHACVGALARAMQKAADVGERLRLDLTLARPAEDGDESSRVRTRCALR